ncbi:copper-binding protein [Herbaspirillum sp. B65]|uniref:copper-binding protein n=1 Tax=Herbaspirillum sp. B65 TaxID=137708 RepID=UPI00034789D7|nr:copper-binding protein [Herbaspirillum sp. B65]
MLRALLFTASLLLPMLAAQAQDQPPKVDGEIRKIDAATGKLTIRHGEIPNLQMPGMTMVFKAAPEILDRARAGEKISFTAERIDGALTVTSLEEKN